MILRPLRKLTGALTALAAGLLTAWSGAASDPSSGLSSVRVTITGADVQYPAGTSLIKNGGQIHGYNWGAFGAITDADIDTVVASMVSAGVKIVRIVGWCRWFGQYNNSPGSDSRLDAVSASFNPENRRQLLKFCDKLAAAGIWYVIVGESDCGQSGMQDQPTRKYCMGISGGFPVGAGPQSWEVPSQMDATGAWTPTGGSDWDAAGGYNFFTSPFLFSWFVERWKLIAHDFRTRPFCLGYELLSEPMPNPGGGLFTAQYDATWTPRLYNFYRVLITTIDRIDGGTPYIGGARDAYGLNPQLGELVTLLVADAGRGAGRPIQGRMILTWDQLGGGATYPNNWNEPSRAIYAATMGFPLFLNQLGTRVGDDTNSQGLLGCMRTLKAFGVICVIWQYRNATGNNDVTDYGTQNSTDGGLSWTDVTSRKNALTPLFTETLTALEAAAQTAATNNSAILLYKKVDGSNVTFDGTHPTQVSQLTPAGTVSGLNLVQHASGVGAVLLAAATPGLVDQRGALSFDGSTTQMDTSAAYYAGSEDQTVIVAALPTGAGVQTMVAFSDNGTSLYPQLGLNSVGKPRAVWENAAGTTTVTITSAQTGSITGNSIVLTATKAGNTKKLFVNGTQEGSTDSTVLGTTGVTRGRVGALSNAPSLAGAIGLLCVCKSAMSDADRLAIERLGAYLVGAPHQA